MPLFSPIIGNQTILQVLERDLKNKKLAHASLFTGPEHVGKWHVAMRLAKGFFCETACGHCRNCHLIEAGTHPDVSVFADDGESFKIESVRNLVHTVSLTAQGEQRCIVIDQIERMPIEAQNAFLKTLEEPAGNCFFILTSNDLNRVLPTILSRVRQYRFFPVSHEEIEVGLIQEHRLDASAAQEIAELAQGRPGLAFTLLHQPLLRQDYQNLYRKIDQFFTQNNLLAKMQFVETLEKDPDQLKRFFEMSFYYLRKALYQGVQPGMGQHQTLSLKQLGERFESLVKTRYLIRGNVNKRLALENFFLATER